MSDLIGKSLGRYRILEQIGEGGMSSVYKAIDTVLDRYVAIKFILKDRFPAYDLERILQRFIREAKALAKLSHPNIVKILDYGDSEGSPYLVMEYLPGGTLKHKMSGNRMNWQDAIDILLPVCRALIYVHENGIIHRDIKPSNIMFTQTSEPMLADFGIAKILEGSNDVADATLTGTDIGIGTPDYMAPEQGTGQSDERADIYALGTVFYQMVTGRLPFKADTPMAVMLRKSTEPLPSPRQFVPNLPGDLERILIKALQREPKNRYKDMQEFEGAIEQLTPPTIELDGIKGFDQLATDGQKMSHRAVKDEKDKWLSRLLIKIRRFFSQPIIDQKTLRQNKLETFGSWKKSDTMTVNLIAALEPTRQKNILLLINREHELRIKDILVHYGGGRYLIHGFGRFGASALIDQIVGQTRSDIKSLHPENKQGIIMMVRVELNDLDDDSKVFKAIVRDFQFEAQREKYTKSIAKRLHRLQSNNFTRVRESGIENTISIKATPIPGLETSFSRKSDKTMGPVGETTTESGIIDVISQFLNDTEEKKPNLFEKIVEKVASTRKTPSRVIVVIDKIHSDKVFRVLQNMRLFSDDRITFFAIVREEQFAKWDSSVYQMINDIGFREYYVPCVWEEEHHLAQEMVKLSLGKDSILDETTIDFINHVAYKSRGAPGDIIKELVDPMYNTYETGIPQLRLDLLRDKKVVRFHSMLQNFLSNNWDKILGDSLLGIRDIDRAKIGVYELMDWMTQQIEFNLNDLEQLLFLGKVSINPSSALRRDVVKHLIDRMTIEGLLSMKQDLYRIILKEKVKENTQEDTYI